MLCALPWFIRHTHGRASDVVFWHDDEGFFASTQPAHPLPIEATLAARLRFWNATPVADNDRWLRYSDEACEGRTASNEVWQEVNVKLAKWRATTSSEVRNLRDGTIRCVLRAQASGRLLWRATADRGIVFTAGNGDTVQRVLVTTRILRARGVTLPIEVFHYPDESLPPDALAELGRLGASVRAISNPAIVKTAGSAKNFQIKATAVVESSFRHVLSLDSDNIPYGDGEADLDDLFESKAYRRLGMLLFPDYWKTSPMSAVWRVIGCQCRDEFEIDSGVVLVDRAVHMDVLALVECMLSEPQLWFTYSAGDKDLWRFALLALRKRWAVPGRHVGVVSISPLPGIPFAGHSMLQHSASGRPLFIHANMLKEFENFGYRVTKGSTWTRVRRSDFGGNEADRDVEADHLANAALDGTALLPSRDPYIRRRALLERGLRFAWGNSDIIRDFIVPEWSADFPTLREVQARAQSIPLEDPLETIQANDTGILPGFEDMYFTHGGRARW